MHIHTIKQLTSPSRALLPNNIFRLGNKMADDYVNGCDAGIDYIRNTCEI